jgi:hypothetical protein
VGSGPPSRDAEDRLARWRSQARIDPRYARQWQKILAKPHAQIARLIGADTPRMRDLRQSSPLAGALSEPERRRVLAAVDETPSPSRTRTSQLSYHI